MKKLLLTILFLVVNLFASYESGKKIFTEKCSSCHVGYIPMKVLKENFFEKDNKILNLKAPSVNMIVFAIKDSPLHVGDKDDPDMQKIEIEEFLKEYLYNPKVEDSICEPTIFKHYDKKENLKGKISEDEIALITEYLFEYKKERRKKYPKKVKVLSDSNDTSLILKQAKKENKIILIEAMSQTCHFCKIMEEEVFTQENIQDKIDKDFVLITVDIDKTKLPFGLDKNYKGMTPSFFTIDADGKLMNEYPGSWSKEDFIEILNENK